MNGIAVWLFGYVISVTWLLVTSQAALKAPRESQDCRHSSFYNHLKSLTHNSCAPMDDQWYYLYHLTNSQSHAHCAREAASYLRDYFKHNHARSGCSCSVRYTSDTSLTHITHSNTLQQCLNANSNYRDIFDTTFYDSQGRHHQRTCRQHTEEWGKLAAISDNTCFIDLVYHFDRTFFHYNNRRCSCHQTTDGGSGVTQHPPQSQLSSDSCMQYSQYQYLDKLLAHDTCISHFLVWSYLDQLTSENPNCRTKIISRLNAAYGHFSHTPSNCTCNTNFDSLHFYNTQNGQYQSCKSEHHYYALMSQVINSNHQVCSSHHTVWSDLSRIPHTYGHNYHSCQKDAISHIAASVSHVNDPCVCLPANTVTSTPSTTTASSPLPVTSTPSTTTASSPLPVTTTSQPIKPTTTAPSLPDFKICNTIALTVGLAYGEIIQEGNLTCSDGSHALSEAAPMKLCNATNSSKWVKGQQVITHCDSIPLYSAIASFAGQVYTHDGLAGVFLGCNSTHISIASEDCTHGLSRFSIPRDGRDSYAHSAINYFTISW